MKKLTNGIMGLIIVIGLAGCGTTWTNLDNSNPNKNKIENALIKCEFEKERTLAKRYIVSSYSGTQEQKDRMNKLADSTYKNAVKCMNIQGLKK